MKQFYTRSSFLFCMLVCLTIHSQNIRFTHKISSGQVELLHHSSDYYLLDGWNWNPNNLPQTNYALTLTRMNKTAGIVWSKQYLSDTIQAMKVMGDDGVLLVGTRNHAVTLLRTDSTGKVIWAKEYRSACLQRWPQMTFIAGFDMAPDSSLLVCAQNPTKNGSDTTTFLVFSTTINGNLKWVRGFTGAVWAGPVLFNGPNSFTGTFNYTQYDPSSGAYRSDSANSISWMKSIDGGPILAGFMRLNNHFVSASISFPFAPGAYGSYAQITLFDSVMNTIKRLSTYSRGFTGFTTVKSTPDGGLIAGGWYETGAPVQSGMLAKMDTGLHVEWTKQYQSYKGGYFNQSNEFDIQLQSIQVLPDKGYLLAGRGWLMQTDSSGTIGCIDTSYSPPYNIYNYGGNGTLLTTPKADTASILVSSANYTAVSMLPADTLDCIFITGIQEPSRSPSLEIMPNPCSDKLQIRYELTGSIAELHVFSLLGKEICSQRLFNSITELNTSTWPPGLYFLSVLDDDRNLVKKILKQ